MRRWIIGAIVLASAVAGIWSEILLFRMVDPPDTTSAFLGGLWVALPFIASAGLALRLRRHAPSLIVLLIVTLVIGFVGVSLLDASATQMAVAEQQARDAVGPGEDPSHGPAGKRKAGADTSLFFSGAFSILLTVVLPPVQLVSVLIATVLAYLLTLLIRGRQSISSADSSARTSPQ